MEQNEKPFTIGALVAAFGYKLQLQTTKIKKK